MKGSGGGLDKEGDCPLGDPGCTCARTAAVATRGWKPILLDVDMETHPLDVETHPLDDGMVELIGKIARDGFVRTTDEPSTDSGLDAPSPDDCLFLLSLEEENLAHGGTLCGESRQWSGGTVWEKRREGLDKARHLTVP